MADEIPGWRNCTRQSETALEYEPKLQDALRSTDIALGIMGSNQLRATALAKMVVTLMPLEKYDGFLTDCLHDREEDWRFHVWRLRYVFGNSTLSDVSARQLAQLMNSMLSGAASARLYCTRAGACLPADSGLHAQEHRSPVAPDARCGQDRARTSLDINLCSRLAQWMRGKGAQFE